MSEDEYADALAKISEAAGIQADAIIDNMIEPIANSWKDWLDKMRLSSEFVPVQSMEQVQNEFDELLSTAQAGGAGSEKALSELMSYVESDYLPFMQKFMKESEGDWKTFWEGLFGTEGVLTQIEVPESELDIEGQISNMIGYLDEGSPLISTLQDILNTLAAENTIAVKVKKFDELLGGVSDLKDETSSDINIPELDISKLNIPDTTTPEVVIPEVVMSGSSNTEIVEMKDEYANSILTNINELAIELLTKAEGGLGVIHDQFIQLLESSERAEDILSSIVEEQKLSEGILQEQYNEFVKIVELGLNSLDKLSMLGGNTTSVREAIDRNLSKLISKVQENVDTISELDMSREEIVNIPETRFPEIDIPEISIPEIILPNIPNTKESTEEEPTSSTLEAAITAPSANVNVSVDIDPEKLANAVSMALKQMSDENKKEINITTNVVLNEDTLAEALSRIMVERPELF